MSQKPFFRVIGDCHGHISIKNRNRRNYLNLIKKAEYSLQLGDMGFNYSPLANVDSDKHRVIGGNHDNYDNLTKHFLGDFGVVEVPFNYFFIRGELSVDKKYRVPNVSWWQAEEMTTARMNECISAYAKVKPELVFSHGCPHVVFHEFITNTWKLTPSNTSQMLTECFNIHQPRVWVFGHHHQTKRVKYGNTIFQCLNELDFLDFKPNGHYK